tara:strand:+ start:3544 stop:3708 length:165 start_codon:yes stop_codon:yes gene_type:complete
LIAASSVTVEAKLGGSGYGLASLLNPQAAIIKDTNNQFDLSLKDGVARMNGKPL